MGNAKDFDSWVAEGIENGWVGPPVCYTHDGVPTSSNEDVALEDDDICMFIMRCYSSPEERKFVEANHSPTIWRNRY